MIEDFTHVLPEDRPPRKSRPAPVEIFDLDEANAMAKYYHAFRQQLEDVAGQARQQMARRAAALQAGKL